MVNNECRKQTFTVIARTTRNEEDVAISNEKAVRMDKWIASFLAMTQCLFANFAVSLRPLRLKNLKS